MPEEEEEAEEKKEKAEEHHEPEEEEEEDELRLSHSNILNSIRKERNHLQQSLGASDSSLPKSRYVSGLMDDQLFWMDAWIVELAWKEGQDATEIIQKCSGLLEQWDRRNFILTNLLEAYKQGGNMAEVAKKLAAMGMLSENAARYINSEPPSDAQPVPIADALPENEGPTADPMARDAGLIDRMLASGLRLVRKVLQLVANGFAALKKAGKLSVGPYFDIFAASGFGIKLEAMMEWQASEVIAYLTSKVPEACKAWSAP